VERQTTNGRLIPASLPTLCRCTKTDNVCHRLTMVLVYDIIVIINTHVGATSALCLSARRREQRTNCAPTTQRRLQEAQLSQRGYAMLRVVEHFAKSLSVTENGRPTLRKLGYGLPFTFHSNYDDILYRFRDKARYWSKISIFFIPRSHWTPPLGRHLGILGQHSPRCA